MQMLFLEVDSSFPFQFHFMDKSSSVNIFQIFSLCSTEKEIVVSK